MKPTPSPCRGKIRDSETRNIANGQLMAGKIRTVAGRFLFVDFVREETAPAGAQASASHATAGEEFIECSAHDPRVPRSPTRWSLVGILVNFARFSQRLTASIGAKYNPEK